eukprot:GCRY01005095.1.p1 GENE.GCRY01005095.1~~GCRY01005095.1.p1  ORF type:complete len:830 (+),score=150.71 GCRY01005095.1:55-2544(+)
MEKKTGTARRNRSHRRSTKQNPLVDAPSEEVIVQRILEDHERLKKENEAQENKTRQMEQLYLLMSKHQETPRIQKPQKERTIQKHREKQELDSASAAKETKGISLISMSTPRSPPLPVSQPQKQQQLKKQEKKGVSVISLSNISKPSNSSNLGKNLYTVDTAFNTKTRHYCAVDPKKTAQKFEVSSGKSLFSAELLIKQKPEKNGREINEKKTLWKHENVGVAKSERTISQNLAPHSAHAISTIALPPSVLQSSDNPKRKERRKHNPKPKAVEEAVSPTVSAIEKIEHSQDSNATTAKQKKKKKPTPLFFFSSSSNSQAVDNKQFYSLSAFADEKGPHLFIPSAIPSQNQSPVSDAQKKRNAFLKSLVELKSLEKDFPIIAAIKAHDSTQIYNFLQHYYSSSLEMLPSGETDLFVAVTEGNPEALGTLLLFYRSSQLAPFQSPSALLDLCLPLLHYALSRQDRLGILCAFPLLLLFTPLLPSVSADEQSRNQFVSTQLLKTVMRLLLYSVRHHETSSPSISSLLAQLSLCIFPSADADPIEEAQVLSDLQTSLLDPPSCIHDSEEQSSTLSPGIRMVNVLCAKPPKDPLSPQDLEVVLHTLESFCDSPADALFVPPLSLLIQDEKNSDKIASCLADFSATDPSAAAPLADFFGRTPFHYLAAQTHRRVLPYAQLLLTAGVDPHTSCFGTGDTALHFAAYHRNNTLLLFLLKNAPELALIENAHGQLPLHSALLPKTLSFLYSPPTKARPLSSGTTVEVSFIPNIITDSSAQKVCCSFLYFVSIFLLCFFFHEFYGCFWRRGRDTVYFFYPYCILGIHSSMDPLSVKQQS